MARSGGGECFHRTDGVCSMYLREIGKQCGLSADEESRLARRIRDGDTDALNVLVRANLRFVVSVSRNYLNQGLPLVDLINEGNIGLIRAARRFDERKNFKFISYAVWWIRQAILQALAEQSRIVRVPLNRVGVIHRVTRAHGKLEQRLRRQPSMSELAREMAINEPMLRDTVRIGNGHVSLDAPLEGRGDDARVADVLRETTAEPDGELGEVSLRAEVERALSTLTERERRVLQLYFGIGEDAAHTLEEIGGSLRLTRERVRQIKVKALRRLKHVSRSMRLRQYR
jgi:RNA polymerase primary sigma factor